MKPHYTPVSNPPIFFYMKSTSEVILEKNGFKYVRVAFPVGYRIYLVRGAFVWHKREEIYTDKFI